MPDTDICRLLRNDLSVGTVKRSIYGHCHSSRAVATIVRRQAIRSSSSRRSTKGRIKVKGKNERTDAVEGGEGSGKTGEGECSQTPNGILSFCEQPWAIKRRKALELKA